MALYDNFIASPASVNSFLSRVPSATGLENQLAMLRESGTPIDYAAILASKQREQQILEELENKRQEGLVRTAYEQTYTDRIQESLGNEELDLANSLRAQATAAAKAGVKQEKIDPIIKRAEQFQKMGETRLKTETDTRQSKQDQATEILFGVNSQRDLDAAAVKLADLGLVLPENLRQFNQQTKEALMQEATKSKKGMELREKQLKIEKEMRAVKEAEKEEMLSREASEATQASKASSASQLVTILDEAIDRVSTPAGQTLATGFVGGATSYIWGTPGYNLQELLVPVVSNEAFTQMQALKDASDTGATGLGPIAIKEFEALQKTRASLSVGQDPKQLKNNLTKIKNSYTKILGNMLDEGKEDILQKYGLLDEALAVTGRELSKKRKNKLEDSVVILGKVYNRPEDFTDDEWEQYKSEVGY
jgi:hypothetical protein